MPCDANTFSVGGTDTCTPCEGSHSDVRASVCVNTPSGYYHFGNTDLPCSAGRYSASGASSYYGCKECGNGKFSGEGAAYCSTAEAGKRIVEEEGMRVNVTDCEKKTFSTGASDDCTPCGEGGHSEAGSAACLQTAPGQHFNETLQKDVNCPRGTFSYDGEPCTVCKDGFVTNETKSSHCVVCEAGTRSNDDHTECLKCEKWAISGTAKATCVACEKGKFQNEEGQAECQFYDKFVKRSTADGEGATSVDDCFCEEKFFQDGDTCKDVFEGIEGDVNKTTLETLPLQRGFWRTSNSSDNVRSCMVKEACVGGEEVDGYCRDGHGGPYCNVCEDGYNNDVLGLCVECEETLSAGNIIITILLVMLFIVVIVVLKKKFYKKYKRQIQGLKASAKIMFVSYQVTAVLPSIAPEVNLPESFTESMAAISFVKLDFF